MGVKSRRLGGGARQELGSVQRINGATVARSGMYNIFPPCHFLLCLGLSNIDDVVIAVSEIYG